MSDTSIPPTPPKSAPNTAGSGGQKVLQSLPVEKIPSELQNQKTEGRVIAHDTAKGETRIATDRGEIVVKNDTPIPSDTDVIVETYVEKRKLLAKITILRIQNQTADVTEEIKAPPRQELPPVAIQIGDVLPAIIIPDMPPMNVTAQVPVEMAEQISQQLSQQTLPLPIIAQVLHSLPPLDTILENIPPDFPSIPQTLQTILQSPNILSALEILQPQEQQEIFQFLSQKPVLNILEKIIPSEIFQPFANALPATKNSPLLHRDQSSALEELVRVQITNKMTQNPVQNIGLREDNISKQPNLQNLLSKITDILPLLSQKIENTPFSQLLLSSQKVTSSILHDLSQKMPENMYQVTIKDIIPADPQGKPAQNVAVTGNEIKGIFDHTTPAGFAVITTEEGDIVLQTKAAIKPHTTFILTTIAMTPDQMMATLQPTFTPLPPVTGFEPLDILHGKTWPALQEVLQTVSQITPDMATPFKNSLPTASAKLTPATLFFMAAMRTGLVENWMGHQIVQTLRASDKKGLIEKLASDFLNISNTAKTPLSGEWRAISVPLWHDEQINQMQFFVRQQPDPDAQDDNEEGTAKPMTRFILNLHLSRMGDMQLDGLLHKKEFNLILRSQEQLSFAMRQDLMKAFATGLTQVAMEGGIRFQTRADKWETPAVPQHSETMI